MENEDLLVANPNHVWRSSHYPERDSESSDGESEAPTHSSGGDIAMATAVESALSSNLLRT